MIVMKKITLILLLIFSFSNVQAKPPFKTSLMPYWSKDIITPDDPTTFQELIYIGEEKRNMYHAGIERGTAVKRDSKKFIRPRPYVYHAFYENGFAVELLVYYKHENNKIISNADILALEYAKALGRLPQILLQRFDALHVFADLPGISNSVTNERVTNLYTINEHGKAVTQINALGLLLEPLLEETLVHELVHTSLDKSRGKYKPLNPRISKDKKKKTIELNWKHWRKAQKRDKEFITQYAKQNLNEDLAESFLMWLVLRYKKGYAFEKVKEKILKAIPNRIKFFDDQNFNMYPLVSD